MLQEAGHKPTKEDRKIRSAQERILNQVFDSGAKQGTGYADPAAMFQ